MGPTCTFFPMDTESSHFGSNAGERFNFPNQLPIGLRPSTLARSPQVAALTTALGFLNPYTRMGGTELVYDLFAECQPGGDSHGGLCVGKFASITPVISAIATAMLIRGSLTVITFGTKVPAGIFIPTLGAFISLQPPAIDHA
jgi:H+/Cl- antiporter ClcA